MAGTTSKANKLGSSLKNLTLSPTTPASSKSKRAPADSWEDESSSSASSSPTTPTQESIPNPPPPTPISPSHHRREKSTDWVGAASSHSPSAQGCLGYDAGQERARGGEKRPEKSNATASRMIAGALGVKGQKMGEEQKRYERAVREKERKRIEGEKEEGRRREREREEAKRSIWDD